MKSFNSKESESPTLESCHQVLAQDCTEKLRFIVLTRRENSQSQRELLVYISHTKLDIFVKNNQTVVEVNGTEYQVTGQRSELEKGITIQHKNNGVALSAPGLGLKEVFYSKDTQKVVVTDVLKGKMCGMCGHADGEVRQEYRTPNNRVVSSGVSHAHTWTLATKTCRNQAGCKLQQVSVKLEGKVNSGGMNSKCYSVVPVLRCNPGCQPLRTKTIPVGYHCIPQDSNLSSAENIFNKSVDVERDTAAHEECQCTPQCS